MAQAYRNEIEQSKEKDKERAEWMEALVQKNDEWKKQTAIDLSDYSPEAMEKTLQKAVNQHLITYKASLNEALISAKHAAAREKAMIWLNHLTTFGLFAVTIGLMVGSIKFFMGL